MSRIGVDLDGVIFDMVTPLVAQWNYGFDTSFTPGDITEYKMWEVLGVSQDLFQEWYSGEVTERGFLVDLPLYPDADLFLSDLSYFEDEYGATSTNDIVFITARQPRISAIDTAEALSDIEVLSSIEWELHFCEQKWRVDCDVYIDDNPYLLRPFQKANKELILMERPWTQHVKGTFSDYESIIAYLKEKSKHV